ncbi:hypothetical protein KWJ32_20875 [Brucella sp. BTU2]|nr:MULTISPECIES: hypothetical protein [Brucella/Ochrobactrum group]MCQ9147159.1 hypothetical protein [Ochrobactrum sp. BTU2]
MTATIGLFGIRGLGVGIANEASIAAGCAAEGFALAMDVSCHSFIRMARLAAPRFGCLRR